MRADRIGGALMLLALAAGCSDRMADYPTLLPTQQILAEPALPAHAAQAGGDPGAALTDRAAGLTQRRVGPVTDDALAARADALRQRAAALRRTAPDCPDGQDCAPADPAAAPAADSE